MRPRLLVPLLVLLGPACPPADETTSGFVSGPATTAGPGPSSFGTSSEGMTTNPASTTNFTTGPTPTTGEPTSASTSTGVPASTGSSDTTAMASASDATSGTDSTGGAPTCGDGIIDGDEFCDDGNMSDGDACLSDCTAGTAVLTLVSVGTQAAIAAMFTPDIGWTSEPAPMGIAEAELETTPEGAMAVIRRASAKPEEDGELWYARWNDKDPALFGMYSQVGMFGFASDGPSLAAVPDTVTLAFLGTDNKHYTVLHSNDAWGAFTKLPAGMVEIQAFGPSGAVVVPGQLATYAAYTGDDSRIYYSAKASPGGAWAASQATPPASVLGPPVGVVDEAGDLLLAYVRKSDGKIALIKLLTPQNAWTPEALVHPTAITGSELAFIRLAVGSYALAWRGFDNEGVYLATGTAHDAWDAPVTIELPQVATTRPALVHGVYGADLEILYTAGGKLRHARLADGKPIPPIDVPDIAGATAVAATMVALEP